MRNTLRYFATSLALASASLLASYGAVLAQTPSCQIGIQAGGSIASTELSGSGASIDGAGARSTRPDVGARVGCDLMVSALKVGAFGEWNYQDVAFQITSGSSSFTGALGNSYSLGGRAGIMVLTAYAYGLVAYTHTDANWSASFPLTGAGLPGAFTGITYGGGVEIPLRDTRMSLALETRWTRYNAEAIGTSGIDLKPDQLQGMLRLNWNFGDPLPTAAKPLK